MLETKYLVESAVVATKEPVHQNVYQAWTHHHPSRTWWDVESKWIRAQKKHKQKGMFSGSVVPRFTGGFRPQGHLLRVISDVFGVVFRRGIFLPVAFLYVVCRRLNGCLQTASLVTQKNFRTNSAKV
jgi:hypothetical protein